MQLDNPVDDALRKLCGPRVQCLERGFGYGLSGIGCRAVSRRDRHLPFKNGIARIVQVLARGLVLSRTARGSEKRERNTLWPDPFLPKTMCQDNARVQVIDCLASRD